MTDSTEIKIDSTNKENNSFPRGKSLENDFRRLIDDERFYDIALKCSDGTIHGCKIILATRSDVFNSCIFGESAECNSLSFDNISSTAMKIILEFLYTSKFEKLTVDNIVEVYYASIHFDLIDLQNHIIEFLEPLMSGDVDVGRKLLSEYVEIFSLRADNEMSRILVEQVARNKLEKSETDSLSLEGLKYLLEKTFDTKIPFATPEFNVWEYTLVKAIKKVIQNEILVEKILNENSFSCNTQKNEEVKSLLTPLIRYINLNRIDIKEIKQHVEPFKIFSEEELKDAYYFIAMNGELGFIRGVPIFKLKNNNVNKQLIISDHGNSVKVVCKFALTSILEDVAVTSILEDMALSTSILEGVITLTQTKVVSGDLIFKGKGVYEWSILIEKLCGKIYIGICDINENLNKAHKDYLGWVLGSDGYIYHNNKYRWYDARFKGGDRVTIHLDMKMMTCAFSINEKKKPIVTEWKNISSQVYPVVFLGRGITGIGSELRIEPQLN